MGTIVSSSISFTRFRIIDPIPSELLTQIPDKLRQFAFRDIDDLPEMQAYGWVCFEDMLDTEWRTAPPQKGNYVTFSLRLDTRRIPPAIIKKQLSLALKAEKEKMQAQGKKFISRERKKRSSRNKSCCACASVFCPLQQSSMSSGSRIAMKSGLPPLRGR